MNVAAICTLYPSIMLHSGVLGIDDKTCALVGVIKH